MTLPTMPHLLASREYLRIGGGFGAPAAGASPAGGLDIDHQGHLATDGAITAAGGLSAGDDLLLVDPDTGKVLTQNLEVAGDLTVTGRDMTWAAWLHAADGFPTSNAGCSVPAQTQVRLREVEYRALDFAPAVDQRAVFNVVLPPHYSGSALAVDLFWTFESGTPGGEVRWVVNALCLDDGDAMNQSITPSAAPVVDTADVAQQMHRSTTVTTPVNAAAGAYCNLLIIRSGSHINDTFNADARLIAVRIRQDQA